MLLLLAQYTLTNMITVIQTAWCSTQPVSKVGHGLDYTQLVTLWPNQSMFVMHILCVPVVVPGALPTL